MNLSAIAKLKARFPALEFVLLVLIERGGDNLAATFSPEFADVAVYVIDAAMGEEIPRKGGPGLTRSDLLIINKADLAPHAGVSIDAMRRNAAARRKGEPFLFTDLNTGKGASEVIAAICRVGGLIMD